MNKYCKITLQVFIYFYHLLTNAQDGNEQFFNCNNYPLYPGISIADSIANTRYDSAYRVDYAFKHNYPGVIHTRALTDSFYRNWILNRYKVMFTPALLGLIDTAKLHEIRKKMREYPDSSDLGHIHDILACNVVGYGKVVAAKYEFDDDTCYGLKIKYVIEMDSIVYSNVNMPPNKRFLAGIYSGFTGGCSGGPDSTFARLSHERIYQEGDEELFFLSNSGLINHEFEKRHYYTPAQLQRTSEAFCQNLLRIEQFPNPEKRINTFLQYQKSQKQRTGNR